MAAPSPLLILTPTQFGNRLEELGVHPWNTPAPIAAPTPAPTRPPTRRLRRRCLFSMNLTRRTSCLGMVCPPALSWYTIAVSVKLTKVPECFFELVSTTCTLCPGDRVLKFVQEVWSPCAKEAMGMARRQIRNRVFRMNASSFWNFSLRLSGVLVRTRLRPFETPTRG